MKILIPKWWRNILKCSWYSQFIDIINVEKGYNAIAGIRPQPINSWGEFKKVLRQLKDERAKEIYETVIVDTADIAYDYCSKYICANAGADTVADISYGKGYGLVANEFDTCLRSIVQMGYGIVLISHATDKTFTDEQGKQYNKIVPTLDKRANNIVSRMADIIGYSRIVSDAEGNESTKLFMRGTSRFEAGSRFKYTPPFIDFTYEALVNAIGEAIDKQAEVDGNKELFTDKRENAYFDTTLSLDFDELMTEFNDKIKSIATEAGEEKFKEYWQPRITEIIERYIGKGNKVNDMNRDQIEQLDLIVSDLKDLK